MEILKSKGNEPISGWPTLTHAEMYSKSTGAPDHHPINDKLLDCMAIVKEQFGELKITSTFRTAASNAAAGGASKSQHLLGNACDSRPVDQDKFETFRAMIGTKTGIYNDLVSAGARGFGIYHNFVHIDVRPAQNPVHWNDTGLTWQGLVETALDPEKEDRGHMLEGVAKDKAKKHPFLVYGGIAVVVWWLFLRRNGR